MRHSTFAILCLPLFALPGCPDSGNEDRDAVADVVFPDGEVTPDSEVSSISNVVELCDALARVRCALDACFDPRQRADEACFEHVQKACNDTVAAPIGTHLEPGDLTFSAQAANDCLAPFLAAGCETLSPLTGEPPAACDAVFIGKVEAGAACEFDLMCKAGLYCKPGSDGGCPGTCAPYRVLGETCNRDVLVCGPDLVCSSATATEGTCLAAKVQAGEPCARFSQCPTGTFCDDRGTKRCEPSAGLGEACPSGGGCATNLFCGGTLDDRKCVTKPVLGDACELSCGSSADLLCSTSQKKCVAVPQNVGDPCVDAAFGCGLLTGLQCDPGTNTCVGPVPLGGDCGGQNGLSDCDFGYCDGNFTTAGKCRPFKDAGAACESYDECGPSLGCSDGVCKRSGFECRGPFLFE